MILHFTSGTNTAANASAYQVTGGEWASGTIQWSNKPAANTLLQSNISHNNVTGYVFSCLAAVQHWYDGDTTGQNENYGIMLRYYNESTADYNAVYSADYSDATKRPSLTIYYQPVSSKVNMPVGRTRTLTVDDYAGTITWTSNNTSVATVNSSGVVTGIKVGTATITAYVGGIEYKTFTVRVTIADGVYRITNTAGLNLGTYGSIAENTKAKMLSYSDTGFEKLYQLWKIAYLGNGYYSIRPLHKLDMGLHAAGSMGSFVDIVSMGNNDTLGSVPSLCRWSISPTADGTSYFINHVGTNSLGMTMDGQVPIVGMDVITDISSETQGYFKWMLDRATDLPSGVKLYDTSTGYPVTSPRTISVGETKSLSDLNLLPIGYSWGMNSTNFEWESEDETIIVDRYTGAVTGVSVGAATITGSYCHNGTFYYVSYTIDVSKLLIYQTENTYYHDGNGNCAEDLRCGDLSEDELRALDWLSWADFEGYTPALHRLDWEFMCTNSFSEGELETVILDMIDHFMDGSGSTYSNSVLTRNVYEHDSTQGYIASVKEQLGVLLNEYDGDMDAFAYTASTRDSNPLVLALQANEIKEPNYDTVWDTLVGLRICVDGLWGNKIEVSSYNVSGNSYTYTLHFTLYDHFGLDQADVEKFGFEAGFRSWYVLQHYSEYNYAYKPLLTMMEFDVTISGTIS